MPTMEEGIVLFVFAELVGLGVVIVVSCWCCRRSVRREREEEEEHALPVTRVGRDAAEQGEASKPKAHAAGAGTSNSQGHATDATHSADGASAHYSGHRGDASDHESHDDDGLVSGGLWRFIAGYPAREPRRTSHSTMPTATVTSDSTARPGDVEIVNISVNTALDDSDDKLASEVRKSGSAA